MISRLLAVSACSLFTLAMGCSNDAPAASSDDQVVAAPQVLTDAQLAAAIAAVPPTITKAAANQLIAETISPVATTARLKMLNDFIGTRATANDEHVDEYLAAPMEGVLWGTPRDLVSTPAGFGGQTFQTSVKIDSGIAGPTKLKVDGVASADYTLSFVIAGQAISLHVSAGAAPKDTAGLIAAALDAKTDKIQETIGDRATFGAIGGDHAQSHSGIDDVEIDTQGAAVTILVAQNG